jgi:crossover junction endodeoxyribonuclease RusA
MWPELPIEFTVVGTPVSAQSENPKAREEWKARVLAAALRVIERGSWAFDQTRLAVVMFIVKLTLDALWPNVYLDDDLIDRVVVQRFDPMESFTFASPSELLVAAMASDEPVLYIRITEVSLQDVIG